MKEWQTILGAMVFIFLLAAGISSADFSSGSEDKVAIVCFLEGKAWILKSKGKMRSEIDLFDWVKIGELIETDDEASMVIAFSTGNRYRLDGRTEAALGQNGFTSQSGSIKQLEPVPITPQIVSISQKASPGSEMGGIRLRGLTRIIPGLYPCIGAAVLADEAVVTFDSIENVEKYMVEIEDEWGSNIFSEETGNLRVVISKGILKPGASYYLKVRTLEEGKPSAVSEAVFDTINEEHARSRNVFKAQVSQSGDVSNLLLLARVDMALGLRKEACETLKAALALLPDNSEIKNAMSQIDCRPAVKN